MKKIFPFFFILLGLILPARAQEIACDSLVCADTWHSEYYGGHLSYWGRSSRPTESYLTIWSSMTDTIQVCELILNSYGDSIWVPLPLRGWLSADPDTVAILNSGTMNGISYNVVEIVWPYLGFRPWRIQKMSGAGHPVNGDDQTHILYYCLRQRKL